MSTKKGWWSAVLLALALGISIAGAPQAQTTSTTTDVRNFEIMAVDGNYLVIRNETGTYEYTVPDDFRFTIDGRKLSVNELKPGMKGTATVTTKTKISPVTVTEVKTGTVVSATSGSMYVRTPEGVKRFTQSQLNDRGIQMLKDGRVVQISNVQKGDQISATILTSAPPVVLTETEVQATLAQAGTAPPAAAPAQAPAAEPTQVAAASPAPPPASAAPTSASTPPAPASGGTPWLWYILIAIAIAVLWFFFARKKEKS